MTQLIKRNVLNRSESSHKGFTIVCPIRAPVPSIVNVFVLNVSFVNCNDAHKLFLRLYKGDCGSL